jgi:HSP20 family protein
MATVRFDPFKGFESITKKMSAIYDDIEKGVRLEVGSFSPRVDILDNDKQLVFQAELPGIAKEDVKVTINQEKVLVIKGEKKRDEYAEESNDNKCFIKCERNYGSFARSFMLPENVKDDSIKAKFENGVLEIILEKAEPEKPKEVNVNIL